MFRRISMFRWISEWFFPSLAYEREKRTRQMYGVLQQHPEARVEYDLPYDV